MSNQLIKNETRIFYTVQVKEGLYVQAASFAGPERITDLKVTSGKQHAYKYDNEKTATKVAKYSNGKVTKHTRTEVVTEITEIVEAIADETR